MKEEELKAIEGLAAAATPAPWVSADAVQNQPIMVDYEGPIFSASVCDVFTGEIGRVALTIRAPELAEGQHVRNAAFIARSREVVPKLCDEVRAIGGRLSAAVAANMRMCHALEMLALRFKDEDFEAMRIINKGRGLL